VFAQKGDIAVFDDHPDEKISINRFSLGICLETAYSLVVGSEVGYKETSTACIVYRVGK
jgi:hypothetical protein